MKKIVVVAIVGLISFNSCKKEGCTDNTATNFNVEAKKDDGSCQYAPIAQDGFRWKEDGGSEIVADSAFWTTGSWGTGIRAYKGGNSNMFEINWDNQDNTSVGTKTLNSSYGFTYIKGGTTYSNSGTSNIAITAFSNNKLSGNFTISITGGSIASIQATFVNLPKK
ncbi:MAG: hypothetical protein M9916_06880 [Crocinitomicaceae bacterium]|nr:hypothetical protein [Crocinitomicaceae bacterium]